MGGDDVILQKVRSDRKRGIISENKIFREDFYGHNRKPDAKLETIWEIFLGAMDDFTLKILLVAAIVSISNILSEVVEVLTSDHPEIAWIEGFAILVAIFLSSGITTLNDYQK